MAGGLIQLNTWTLEKYELMLYPQRLRRAGVDTHIPATQTQWSHKICHTGPPSAPTETTGQKQTNDAVKYIVGCVPVKDDLQEHVLEFPWGNTSVAFVHLCVCVCVCVCVWVYLFYTVNITNMFISNVILNNTSKYMYFFKAWPMLTKKDSNELKCKPFKLTKCVR